MGHRIYSQLRWVALGLLLGACGDDAGAPLVLPDAGAPGLDASLGLSCSVAGDCLTALPSALIPLISRC